MKNQIRYITEQKAMDGWCESYELSEHSIGMAWQAWLGAVVWHLRKSPEAPIITDSLRAAVALSQLDGFDDGFSSEQIRIYLKQEILKQLNEKS